MRRLLLPLLLVLGTIERPVEGISVEEARVTELIHEWAPLVWLAPGERFLPLGVPEFLDNVQIDDNYLSTRQSLQSLLQNRSSFLHGRKPAGSVPVYALVKNCPKTWDDSSPTTTADADTPPPPMDELAVEHLETNRVPDGPVSSASPRGSSPVRLPEAKRPGGPGKSHELEAQRAKRRRLKLEAQRARKRPRRVHFHVTYWMFYPFSEGKAVCVLDLGFLGSWPIPSLAGVCLGRLKEYGNHVGDWEHVSLYFEDKDHPISMYVSAHDAGAFYRYEARSGTFLYESQETREGIFQKPVFPDHVRTSSGSHPVLFSALGSHGLWTAPGKHRFLRLPRLYDESGFGVAWPTWRKLELLTPTGGGGGGGDGVSLPGWMSFNGKWGNPKSNCHPLAKLGLDICEFVDGPTGIPMKKTNFRC